MTRALELAPMLAEALGLKPGQDPFPWQTRLLQRFLDGDVPRSLDIPTGLGKTATIAIWLLARAHGATVPRRLVYVVDRRAVVDQATEEAVRLRTWVASTPGISQSLDLDDSKLPISTLRGQFVDNREWLEDPSRPAIVIGTIDMVGSRLLFEGYGTSHKMRPYHAGLLGNDSLVVLDEAHLVPPFERIVERIAAAAPDLSPSVDDTLAEPPGLQLLSLSATGRSRGGDAFALGGADHEHREVQRRLQGMKRLSIRTLAADEDLATLVAERAWAIAEEGGKAVRCIVFTNRRQDAEKAKGHLEKLAGLDKRNKGVEPAADVELLVGGRRIFERQRAAETLRRLGFMASSDVVRSRPAFLFATSAGEVGVDLNADHMVSDLVGFERMVQRLGRVNRRGRGDALVTVFAQPPDTDASAEDTRSYEALRKLFARLPMHSDDSRDVSPGALHDLQCAGREDATVGTLIAHASTPPPLYPYLDRPTLDAWSMTSLRQHPGRPAVAPWLRGWVEDRPQTTIIWRHHLPIANNQAPRPADIASFFEAAPPHASEELETETFRAAEWLGKRVKALLKAEAKSRPSDEAPDTQPIRIIVLEGQDGSPRVLGLAELASMDKKTLEQQVLAGARVVVDARLAGLDQGLLDARADTPVQTIDGQHWLDADGVDDGVGPAIRFRVAEVEAEKQTREPSPGWRERLRLAIGGGDDSVSRWLIVDKWRHDATTEEDRSAGPPQLLAQHEEWAAERAATLAQRLGLSPQATKVLTIAARLHDEGKAAARWQTAFHAPNDGIYAKTLGPLNVHILDGYRHEFGSLPIAEADPELSELPSEQRELILHLIASHHGFARPFIRARGCDAPPSALEDRQREVALRFARLQQEWGPWGLAWWESLLRAADQQASRDNDRAEDDSADGSAS